MSTTNNVVDFTHYKLMMMLTDSTDAEEVELLMNFIEQYEEGSIGVVWVGGEPRFFDVAEPEANVSLEDIIQEVRNLDELENMIFDEQDAIDNLGLVEVDEV